MYNIKITRHYYGPTNKTSYVMHPHYSGERMTYATKMSAQAAAAEMDPKELGHNEASYPTIAVVPAK